MVDSDFDSLNLIRTMEGLFAFNIRIDAVPSLAKYGIFEIFPGLGSNLLPPIMKPQMPPDKSFFWLFRPCNSRLLGVSTAISITSSRGRMEIPRKEPVDGNVIGARFHEFSGTLEPNIESRTTPRESNENVEPFDSAKTTYT